MLSKMANSENLTLTLAESIAVEHAVLLIPIDDRFRPNLTALELYEATRGAWRLGARRDVAQYAFSVSAGIVCEVYQIDGWHRAGSTPYQSRPFTSFAIEGRWEFIGRPACEAIRKQYKGRLVAKYLNKGLVTYVNC
jgi:hypothetical protein